MINDFVCIFVLAEYLSKYELQEYFYAAARIWGFDDERFKKLYLMYSTQYHLFDDKPLEEERLVELHRSSKCRSCKTLRRKRNYVEYDLETYACPLCFRSELYRNAREKEEATLLRCFLERNIRLKGLILSSVCSFVSVERICPDYEKGKQLVIPFNRLVYDFLDATGGYGDRESDVFLSDLTNFFMDWVKQDEFSYFYSVFDNKFIKDRFKILLDGLYRLDRESLESDRITCYKYHLNMKYSYTAPSPTVSSSPVSEKKSYLVLDNQLNLMDILPPAEDSASDAPKEVIPTVDEDSPLNLFDENEQPVIETNIDMTDSDISESFSEPVACTLPEDIGVDDIPEINCTSSYEEKPDKAYIPDMELEDVVPYDLYDAVNVSYNTAEEDSVNDGSDEESSDSNEPSTNDSIIEDNTPKESADVPSENVSSNVQSGALNNRKEPGVDIVTYKPPLNDVKGTIYESFIILDSASDKVVPYNLAISFDFDVQFLRAEFVSLAPAISSGNIGLLIYIFGDESPNGTYFFFDLELYGGELLQDLFTDPSSDIYTLYSLECLCLFSAYGIDFKDFCPLDIAYEVVSSCQKVLDVVSLHHMKGKHPLFFLPLYKEWYAELTITHDELSLIRKKQLALKVLSNSYDLSSINEELRYSFSHNGFSDYSFAFSNLHNLCFHTPGCLFYIKIPEGIISSSFSADTFVMDLFIILYRMPYLHKNKLKILTIDDGVLCFYHTGENRAANVFYELFISNLQEEYYKRFNAPLKSSTWYIIYSDK